MARTPPVPAGSATMTPLLVADRADTLIDFIVDVFGAREVAGARTLDADGLILHAGLRLGDSLLAVADRKPDWPFTPGFACVHVEDAAATLVHAVQRGAHVVTRPAPFSGGALASFRDPSGNLWWLRQHDPHAHARPMARDDDDPHGRADPALALLRDTLAETFAHLRDPRGATR